MATPSTHSQNLKGTFRPLIPPRTGERYAWGLAGVMGLSIAAVAWRVGTVPWFLWLLFGFFLISGILSTFSHWVDSQTLLTLDENGLTFRNGLRHVQLAWSQIHEVRILTDRWGKRIQVNGANGQHFSFRTVTEVEIHEGHPQKLFGFPQGEQLAQAIIQSAGLAAQSQTENEVYYARP